MKLHPKKPSAHRIKKTMNAEDTRTITLESMFDEMGYFDKLH